MQVIQVLTLIALFSFAFAQSPISVISRNYYVGGSFNNVKQYNLTTKTYYNVAAKNLASFNGKDGLWSAVAGTGTNGVVETVKVDSCLNIYIGGSFTTVDGVTTGPAAKYDLKTKKWTPVHGSTTVTLPNYTGSRVVYSISVDCANSPTSTDCPCDVYLGGKFSATFKNAAGDQTATNVIKYDYNNKEYEALGGPNNGLDRHRSGTTGASVYAIYKKGFGVFQTPLRYLWVAGNFNNSFNRWDKTAKTWGFSKTTTAAGFDSSAVIYDMYYKTGILFDTDVIYLGGSYTHSSTGCKNICEFDYKQETFSKVAKTDVTSTVYQVDYVTVNSRLVIGTSAETDGLKRMRAVNSPSTTATWVNYGEDQSDLTRPVRSLSACGSALCHVGSYAYVAYNSKDTVPSSDEVIRFWSSDVKRAQKFGDGTDGQARVIVPIVAAANSVIISFASIFIMVIFALVY
eukprot:gene1980-1488_t